MTNCKDCTTNCAYRGKDNQARCGSFVGKVTNADRIRAMTDEELAKVIICPKQECDKVHILLGRTDCEACALEWLKQPAEGDA